MHSSHYSPLKILRMYRAPSWVQFLGLWLLGIATGKSPGLPECILGLGISALYLSYAYAYAINNYYDHKIDATSAKRKNPLAGQTLPQRFFLGAAIMPGILALALSFFLPFPSAIVISFGLILSTFYSIKPFRWKEVRFLGFLLNGFLFSPLFVLGWIQAGKSIASSMPLLLFFALPVLLMELFHELEDMKDDLAGDSHTVPVVIGRKKTRWVIRGMCLLIFFSGHGLFIANLFFFPELFATAAYALFTVIFSAAWWNFGADDRKLRLLMRGVTALYGLVLLYMMIKSRGC